MVAVGDRVLVYEGEDGQLYAVVRASPAVGDRVIVTEGENGQLYATLCGSGAVGDRVQVIESDLGIPLAMMPEAVPIGITEIYTALQFEGSWEWQDEDKVFLMAAGQYCQVTSIKMYRYAVVETYQSDSNDGMADIYVNAIKADDFCTYNIGTSQHVYDAGYNKRMTLKVVCPGTHCGGSSYHVSIGRLIFTNVFPFE